MRLLLVLHQNPDGYPAGIEQYILDLIFGLSFRGLEVSLFFPEKGSLKLRRYRLHAFDEESFEGGFTDFTHIEDKHTEAVFEKVLKTIDPDIIHFQSLRSLPLSLIKVGKGFGKKVIISLHEYFLWCIHFILLKPDFCDFERDEKACYRCLLSQGLKIGEDFVLKRRQYISDLFALVDALISPSTYVRDKFLELYPDVDQAKCTILELGIRKEYFGYVEPVRKENKEEPLRVGFLGNFLYHKGSKVLMPLIDAFKDCREVEFQIFGNIYDPILKDYPNLKKYGHYSRHLIGKVLSSERIDVNLLLSIVPETFSYTLTESVASGVPVIAHDIGALRERVSKYTAGFLVPYENSLPYVTAILRDMSSKREIVHFFKQKCAESSKDILSVDDMIKVHHDFYRKLHGL